MKFGGFTHVNIKYRIFFGMSDAASYISGVFAGWVAFSDAGVKEKSALWEADKNLVFAARLHQQFRGVALRQFHPFPGGEV